MAVERTGGRVSPPAAATGRTMSRRTFLELAAAGILVPASALGKTSPGSYVDHLGVQLYTVRDLLAEKPAETFRALFEAGYRHVENFDVGSLDRLAPLLADAGLAVTSTHFSPPFVTGDWSPWEKVGASVPAIGGELDALIAAAIRHRIGFLVFPYLLPAERGDLDHYRELAAKLNAAGETCRAAGLRLGYHNHAFEFEPQGGSTAFDVLIEELDPGLVQFEIDVFWATFAGFDAVELLRRHAGRCNLLHLKDLKDGIERSPSAQPPPQAFEELGDGIVDFPAVLAAAAELGIEHVYVEQDHCPESPVASLQRSAEYLRGLSL